MEIYWAVISHVTRIAVIGITGYFFSCFSRPFLVRRKHAWLVGASYFTAMLILYFIPDELESTLVYAAGSLAAFLSMYFIDHAKTEQKIFLAVMMYLLWWITHGIAIVPRGILFELIINASYITARPKLQVICYAVVETIYMLSWFLVMAGLTHIIDRIYTCKNENMTKKELGLMLATPMSVLAGYYAFTFFDNAYEMDMNYYIQDMRPEYSWILALYQLISFLAMAVAVASYQGIKESAALSVQIENMKRHIGQVEALYGDIRGLKHDMGNHIMTIENLVLQQEQQEAIAYLANLKKELNETNKEARTGNPVTDVILTEYRREAEGKGIEFLCDFHYPGGTDINAFDVSVILNNALGNAVEAAGKCSHPYVAIQSYRRKNAYIIEVRNNFMGKLMTDEKTGLPQSTKDGYEHGFGMHNIRKVAQKYYGDIDFEQKENEAVLSIMLMVQPA